MRPREPDLASVAHDPWERFAALTDWSLRWAELPAGVMGSTCHRTRTVTLAVGMSQAERRCTIAHETQHVERGPVPPHEEPEEERLIDRTVARLLIPSPTELADALWVDDYLLQVRLATLTDAEQACLHQRLSRL